MARAAWARCTARDTKLNRDVALKILPTTFAADPDRLARFHREAQVLASLNHPHIAAIYGFEDSGEAHALVLEFVDGRTLADRIAQGPIPIDEALPIAIQICEALEAAHEQDVIHRDLKPANIKLRPDGAVKVLDFGLAKLAEPGFGIPDSGFEGTRSMSPTITSPSLMTGVGVLLGTAAYMSPEQAKGRPADKRSDIWAFGCVLYEMLTGKRAFGGDDVTETIASVVKDAPNWTALPIQTSSNVRRVLHRSLDKDVRRRLRDIGDARIDLEEPERVDVKDQNVATATSTRTLVYAGTLGVATIAAMLLAAVHFRATPAESSLTNLQLLRRAVAEGAPPQEVPFFRTPFDENFARFSPGGTWVAYQSDESGRYEIYVRPANADGTAGDGKWQVSTNGGIEARWSSRSNELFYIGSDNMMMAVDVKPGTTFQPGVPRPLFPTRPSGVSRYDVTADGQRFLVSVPTQDAGVAPATIVLNWFQVLNGSAPVQ